MHRTTNSFHKPTLAVACVAVFFSFGGGAYAAKKHYVLTSTKQVSPKTLAKLKGNVGPAGAVGATGATGAPGAKGADGAKGDAGAPGTARAYAYVNTGSCGVGNGPCSFSKAKGIVSVQRVEVGAYCVITNTGADPKTIPAFATVDFRATTGPEGNASAMIDATSGHCDSAGVHNAFEVLTERTPNVAPVVGGGTQAATNAVRDNSVAFTVLIP